MMDFLNGLTNAYKITEGGVVGKTPQKVAVGCYIFKYKNHFMQRFMCFR